jgi:ribosomal protein L30/L7E
MDPAIDPVTTPTDSPAQTISGLKPADTSVWLNGAEILPRGADTIWSYVLALSLGENNITVTVKDQTGAESLPAAAKIIRSENICASWAYSEWGECAGGQQTRIILSAAPTGCVGGEPVLARNCTIITPVNVVEEEKALAKTVNSALAKRLSGRILLQVERSGEAWYVYPADAKKYYLGRPADAFAVMRRLGLGATHEFISSHTLFPTAVLGKILLDVEKNGEAYYINPVDKKAYYLGRPPDAFRIMRELGLGITNSDLRQIGVGELGY